jgi:rhodanese-related sulfurtransferase
MIKRITLILIAFIVSVNFSVSAKNISQGELQALMKNEVKPLLIDVRTEKEYADGHVPGAINIPHKELESRLAELSGAKQSQVVLYCRSGTRAGFAKKVLEKNGFTQLDHLSGDYIAWNKKGLPLVKGDNSSSKKISNPCAL